jgi:hypothetical protein
MADVRLVRGIPALGVLGQGGIGKGCLLGAQLVVEDWREGRHRAARRGRGLKSPVSRREASQRLRLARPTSKVLTTSLRGIPRSMAARTRSRKSTE